MTVNAKHDAASYESCGCKREIFDGNALYEAFRRAERGSDWKPQVQKYEMAYLFGLADIQSSLQNRSYQFLPSSQFVLSERGKTRFINGEQIPDRIVKHALCDEVLTPTMTKYLIYDNGASQQGKGIDFTRSRLLTHLRRYYTQHGSNEGHILLIDFSKYYDNLWHEVLIDLFRRYVSDDCALWLIGEILKRSEIDVSYMTDAEYRLSMFEVFNSLEHAKIDRSLLTGRLFLPKHMNIGDQVAQIAGIAYPIPLDNYLKIVRGIRLYARYMDDSYVIAESRAFLEDLTADIIEQCARIGITVNQRKTRIAKLSDRWRFLQVQYSLTETGRVIRKINPKRVTDARRKMKKLIHHMTPEAFEVWYRMWFRSHYKLMSRQQRENMDCLFRKLREEQLCLLSHSETETASAQGGTATTT